MGFEPISHPSVRTLPFVLCSEWNPCNDSSEKVATNIYYSPRFSLRRRNLVIKFFSISFFANQESETY